MPMFSDPSMSIIKIRTHVLVILIGLALALGLAACGGGGDKSPSYALVIKSAELSAGPALDRLTNYPPDGYALLKGEGFLPPESRCAEDTLPFEFDVIRFDQPGPYKLTWTNTSTSKSAGETLLWSCGTAPTWSAYVPLTPGEN